MNIREISGFADACQRLESFFPCGGTNGIRPEYLDEYARMLTLFSSEKDYTAALKALSKEIWIAYNHQSIVNSPNRYTRAISRVAQGFGFLNADLVVLTAAASPAAFGNLIGAGKLWKDSFALGHGEFAHSYQWLAAGLALGWQGRTVEYYKAARGRSTIMPCWCKDSAAKLTLRPGRLWEYLVDCTQLNNRHGASKQTAEDYAANALVSYCTGARNITTEWIWGFMTGVPDGITPEHGLAPVTSESLLAEANNSPEAIKKKYRKYILAARDIIYANADTWNLLTNPTSKGGAFRNANNVSDLARDVAQKRTQKQEKWFITEYENRRLGKLRLAQNDKLLSQMTYFLNNPKSSVSLINTYDLTSHSVVVEVAAVQKFLSILQSISRSTSNANALLDPFWAFLGECVQGGTVQGSVLQADNPDLLLSPMDALTKQRKQHYRGKNWTIPTKGIYSLTPGMQTVNKAQVPEFFHEVPGSINQFSNLG